VKNNIQTSVIEPRVEGFHSQGTCPAFPRYRRATGLHHRRKQKMDRRKIIGLLLTGVVAAALLGCASGKKQYDLGVQLKNEGRYREAIATMEEAIAAEPKNEAYLRALADTKNALIDESVAQAEEILKSTIPPSLGTIRAAGSKIAQARQIDPNHPAVIEFADRLKKEESRLRVAVKNLYAQAGKNIERQQWVEAHSRLQQIQQLLPGYEDTDRLLRVVAAKGAPVLLEKGKKRFDDQQYKEAAFYFQQALEIDPRLQEAGTYLALAGERDTKEYFFEEGNKALKNGEYGQAERAYRRALTYDPDDEEIQKAISSLRYKATFHYLREARSHLLAGWLFNAYQYNELAMKTADTERHPELEAHLQSLGNELASATAAVAQRFAEKGRYGSSWFWYQKIEDVDPDYPDLFHRSQAMEDEIMRRLRKSIAVFDFAPPNGAPDAGAIFANNLTALLFKNAGKDVKIVDRENLQSKLEETKPGQIGVISSKTAKEMGLVFGIDVAVMGSVLRYNVDATSYSDTKTVTYPVKKTEENIDYLNWKARNPNPTREELNQAPVPFIHKMVDMEKEYKVSTHKKVAFVTVSFRILDVNSGENLLVDTISRNKTATDNTSAGVQVAGIEYDPLEIPTDTELLQELTNEVVEELGREALRPLQTLEKTYFDLGEKHLRRREPITAAEYFINAIFDERIKGITGSQIGRETGRKIEEIFRQFNVASDS
jgi:tetratricopeptide (TPR) repeat protein